MIFSKVCILAFNQIGFDFIIITDNDINPFRVVLGWPYRGFTGGFLLLQIFSVAISVSPHVCFILVLILIFVFLR